MTFYKNIDPPEEKDAFPFDENEDFDEEDDQELDEGEEEEDEEIEKDEEDLDELEQIESKLEKGEDVALSAIEASILPNSHVLYTCPRCKRIYFNKKWVKDNITDIYSVRTELAYCQKCMGKTYENFVGSVEIYHNQLKENKQAMTETIQQVERDLEDAMPFEKVINIVEKEGIFFVFVNTTRLAQEIGKGLRQEFGGGIQYEWFERNQFLRVKWYDKVDNRKDFKERIRALKERRFGMFSFEDEDY